jgi:aminomethyltransferase
MDLSALRKFQITGADALNLLQLAFSRDVAKLAIGQSVYGCLLNPHGGMIDDGIVFRLDEQQFRYVGNCDSDRAWLEKVAQQHEFQVTVRPIDLHNLALQGPLSREILRSIAEFDVDALTYFRFTTGHVAKIPVLVSRTGYTGELGYELFVEPSRGAELWDAIMQAGRSAGIAPLGMLALDRARIEAGLLAAGREFDDLTSPYQAGIGWAVALKKPNFIGKAALEQIKLRPPKVAVGLVLEGNEVVSGGECLHPSGDTVPGARSDRWRVGAVTSGTFSPILNRSIALAQVVPEFASPGTVLEVGLMDGMKRRIRAIVGTLAAYDPTKSRVKS